MAAGRAEDELNLIVKTLMDEHRRQQQAEKSQRDYLISLAKTESGRLTKQPPSSLPDQIVTGLLREQTSKALGGRTLRGAISILANRTIGGRTVEKAITNLAKQQGSQPARPPGAENMHAIAMGLEDIWRKEQGQ